MKKHLFFAFPALVLLLSACNTGNNDGGTPSRDFYAVDNVKLTYYKLTADCLAENDYCMVYADQKAKVDSGIAQHIADVYESKIYGDITDTFGGIKDMDGNGKVILLLLDILDGYTGGGYIAGYFYSLDMMQKSEDPNTIQYHSNEADMLYIDTNPGLQSMSSLFSTMAHELQHLINYSQTAAIDGREPDVWVNEGLSTAAEFIYGRDSRRPNEIYPAGTGITGDPNGRLTVYSDPQNRGYNKNIRCGNNFYIWSDGFWEDYETYGDLGNYSTVYLFFQWLRAHASTGTGIYKDIINSNYRDYRAVSTAVKNRFGSKISLPGDGATEGDWNIVLQSWFLANLLKQSGGLYGYNGCLDYSLLLTPFIRPGDYPEVVPEGNSVWSFAPGEGIYSQLVASGDTTHTFIKGDPHIQYVGIRSDGTPKVVDAEFDVTARYLLTYNKNTAQNPNAEESGDIHRLASAGLLANRLFNEGGGGASWGYLPGNYPVDRDTMARLREGKKPAGRLNKHAR
jgi:hypothetical protein